MGLTYYRLMVLAFFLRFTFHCIKKLFTCMTYAIVHDYWCVQLVTDCKEKLKIETCQKNMKKDSKWIFGMYVLFAFEISSYRTLITVNSIFLYFINFFGCTKAPFFLLLCAVGCIIHVQATLRSNEKSNNEKKKIQRNANQRREPIQLRWQWKIMF